MGIKNQQKNYNTYFDSIFQINISNILKCNCYTKTLIRASIGY